MILVKFKQRVADHGEVFTPAWMVAEIFGGNMQFDVIIGSHEDLSYYGLYDTVVARDQ